MNFEFVCKKFRNDENSKMKFKVKPQYKTKGKCINKLANTNA